MLPGELLDHPDLPMGLQSISVPGGCENAVKVCSSIYIEQGTQNMEQDSAHLSTHVARTRRPGSRSPPRSDAVLLDQAAGVQGRPAGLADAVVRWMAGVATALGRPVEPHSAVPRLAHVAVPEVGGAGSAAVQPHAHGVGLCMAPPQHLNGIWLAVVSPIDSARRALVRQAVPIVIVVGDGLMIERASAWYRGLPVGLGHQVELDCANIALATSVSV
jgi:hypothetical protein